MDEPIRSLLLRMARFLDSYEDHSVMGIAAKKEASELLNKIQALLAMDEREATTSRAPERNEERQ